MRTALKIMLGSFLLLVLSMVLTHQTVGAQTEFEPKKGCPTQEGSAYQPTLRLGHYGLQVQTVQVVIGAYPDGCFGPATELAVKRYQRANDLYVDGIVGNCTWAVINDTATNPSCVTKTQPNQPTDPATQGVSCEHEHAAGQRPVLRIGHFGPKVKELQQAIGAYPDGCFGPATELAVKRYQRANGLHVDGWAGGEVWSSIYAAGNGSSNFDPTSYGSGTRFVVHQDGNHVYLVRGNEVIASSGIVDNPSKLKPGRYWTGWRGGDHVSGANRRYVMPNFVTFAGNIGFHAIPVYLNNGQPFHSEQLLGSDARQSDGCIRTSHDFSEVAYGVPLGTAVYVV